MASLPQELLTASSLIHEDRLFLAEQLCRQYLRQDKQHPEGMRLLAEIGSKLQILDDAEFLLESCVEFHPWLSPSPLGIRASLCTSGRSFSRPLAKRRFCMSSRLKT